MFLLESLEDIFEIFWLSFKDGLFTSSLSFANTHKSNALFIAPGEFWRWSSNGNSRRRPRLISRNRVDRERDPVLSQSRAYTRVASRFLARNPYQISEDRETYPAAGSATTGNTVARAAGGSGSQPISGPHDEDDATRMRPREPTARRRSDASAHSSRALLADGVSSQLLPSSSPVSTSSSQRGRPRCDPQGTRKKRGRRWRARKGKKTRRSGWDPSLDSAWRRSAWPRSPSPRSRPRTGSSWSPRTISRASSRTTTTCSSSSVSISSHPFPPRSRGAYSRDPACVSVAFPRSCTLCTFRPPRGDPRTVAWERVVAFEERPAKRKRDADPRRGFHSSRTRSLRHRAPAPLAGSARCAASRYTSSLEHPRGRAAITGDPAKWTGRDVPSGLLSAFSASSSPLPELKSAPGAHRKRKKERKKLCENRPEKIHIWTSSYLERPRGALRLSTRSTTSICLLLRPLPTRGFHEPSSTFFSPLIFPYLAYVHASVSPRGRAGGVASAAGEDGSRFSRRFFFTVIHVMQITIARRSRTERGVTLRLKDDGWRWCWWRRCRRPRNDRKWRGRSYPTYMSLEIKSIAFLHGNSIRRLSIL